ncbi:MAG: peptidylprolyl isomerase [Saprospiraceae bacterium]
MKYSILFFLFLILQSCSDPKGEKHAIISTSMGEIEVLLYNQTPLHRDNFIKLINEKYYDGLLFHRVMPGFVIQGGDPASRTATADAFLGGGGPDYQITAEIGSPHFKGTLAAARNQNPEKKSSGSQFYITIGRPVSDMELDQVEQLKAIKYNPEQREKYKTIGGLPSLDNEYTVFGEVVSGLDIAEKIANMPANAANRPLDNVTMKIRLK